MQAIVGYTRVSDSKQLDGVSLEAQESKIKSYAEFSGATVLGFESDRGISGKRTGNRSGLKNAINLAVANKACLVVYSLSRLSRNVKDMMEISEMLEKAGADLVSLSERIDTTSASGKMVFRMLAVLSQFEREQLIERTKTALNYKRSQGEKTGGHVPFGFDCLDGEHLTENQKEQEVIHQIQSWREENMTFQQICDNLSSMGIKTKTGKSEWKACTIRAILNRKNNLKAA